MMKHEIKLCKHRIIKNIASNTKAKLSLFTNISKNFSKCMSTHF